MTDHRSTMFRHESMRIAGRKVGGERSGDRAIDVLNPYTSQRIGSVPKATADEVRQAFAVAKAYRSTLTRFERANVLEQDRRARAQPNERGRRTHQRRVGPVHEGRDLRSRSRGRRAAVRRHRVPEGRRPDLQLRPHAARQAAPRVHAARAAARRDQRDHAVQPPDEPGRAQGRAVDRDQQPDGAQALREGAALGDLLRRPALRSRPAAGDALHRDRRPGRDRRRAHHQRARRPRDLHRRRRDRQVHRREAPDTDASCSSSAATTRSS